MQAPTVHLCTTSRTTDRSGSCSELAAGSTYDSRVDRLSRSTIRRLPLSYTTAFSAFRTASGTTVPALAPSGARRPSHTSVQNVSTQYDTSVRHGVEGEKQENGGLG